MTVKFYSHGIKRGPIPSGMDLYLDVRALWEPSQGGNRATRSNSEAADIKSTYEAMTGHTLESLYGRMILDAIDSIPRRRMNNPYKPKDQVHICFMCAWGVNRSVAMKQIMSDWLKAIRPNWEIEVI